MLTLPASPRKLCDGSSRRDFLLAGVIGGLGLSLPALLRAAGAPPGTDHSFGRAKRCLLLFLTGGPPHLDTWDMKPHAPAEVRGELKPISTNVPDIQISELFPKLAGHADKFCLLRSLTHQDTVHTSAGYAVLTGHPFPRQVATATDVRPEANDHPHLGAVLSRVRGPRGGLPPFVALPEIIKDAAVNEFPGQSAGFLGTRHNPLLVEADEAKTGFRLPDIFLAPGVTAARLGDRRRLLAELGEQFRAAERGGRLDALDEHRQLAFDLIRSRSAQQAFQLDREPPRIREAYGPHLFGQGCLLARRLIEAGVSLVTVYWHYEGPDDSPVWDTHANNFPHLRNRLAPPTDVALAALLTDLAERGLLEDTLLVCLGEFGRSPHVNPQGGREHWPQCQSVLLAGAGIRGGGTYGASDRIGNLPADLPVSPGDLAATLLHLLGVPAHLELSDLTDRPHRARAGEVVRGLWA